MKAIKKSTLLELARLTRKYARTGDVDILPARIETAKKLATQAYGNYNAWPPFADFVNAVVGVYALYPKCTNEELCGLFRFLKFDLIDRGVTVQELDGCKYCKEYEDLPEHFIAGKPVGRVFDTCIQPNENGLWHLEAPCGADIGIKFCPMCGRRLPQPPKGE